MVEVVDYLMYRWCRLWKINHWCWFCTLVVTWWYNNERANMEIVGITPIKKEVSLKT